VNEGFEQRQAVSLMMFERGMKADTDTSVGRTSWIRRLGNGAAIEFGQST